MKQTQVFCHDKELNEHDGIEYYSDFYPSELQVRMCGGGKIVSVIVRELQEGETSPYWAWWDEADQEFTMIFQSKVQVQICFAYGYKVEEEKGTGKLTNVFVQPITENV